MIKIVIPSLYSSSVRFMITNKMSFSGRKCVIFTGTGVAWKPGR